jgi:probable rRNA maturation factor
VTSRRRSSRGLRDRGTQDTDEPDPGRARFRVDDRQGGSVDAGRWAELASRVLSDEGAAGGAEMGLLFVDEKAIAELNRQHMGAEGPTDVLAFPIDGSEAADGGLVGDVVICPAVAARQAAEHNADPDDELALLVVHGVLHLLGMDHAEAEDAVAMRSREQHHLSRSTAP